MSGGDGRCAASFPSQSLNNPPRAQCHQVRYEARGTRNADLISVWKSAGCVIGRMSACSHVCNHAGTCARRNRAAESRGKFVPPAGQPPPTLLAAGQRPIILCLCPFSFLISLPFSLINLFFFMKRSPQLSQWPSWTLRPRVNQSSCCPTAQTARERGTSTSYSKWCGGYKWA